MSKTIKGTVTYQNIGTGFWGIIDDGGNEWRIVNMPDQLKYDGKKVSIKAKTVKEEFSTFMWGEPVKVISFST